MQHSGRYAGSSRTEKFVVYYRVSTDKQGQSGLGLLAQRQVVTDYLGNTPVLREFTEIESGKKSDRPELAKALQFASATGAKLLIAKVDRLTRNLGFLTRIMESSVPVVCPAMPETDSPTGRFIWHQMGAFAELERGLISERTKAGLAKTTKPIGRASAEYGTSKGCMPSEARSALLVRSAAKGGIESGKARKRTSEALRAAVLPIVQPMRDNGSTLDEIAEELNSLGVRTARGGQWSKGQVSRLLKD